MTQPFPVKISDITKGSEHDLTLFSEEKIKTLESRIEIKTLKSGRGIYLMYNV